MVCCISVDDMTLEPCTVKSLFSVSSVVSQVAHDFEWLSVHEMHLRLMQECIVLS